MKFSSMKNYLLISTCLLIFSCAQRENSDNLRFISESRELLYELPDSALTLLDGVDVARLNKAQRMEYFLLRLDARSLTGIDVSQDVDIFVLHDWFQRRKDIEKSATAGLHAAEALYMNDQKAEATDLFLKSFDLALKTPNNRLKARIKGRLGDGYYEFGVLDQALISYKEALEFAQDARSKIEIMNKIGNTYQLEYQFTDALMFYDGAEKLSRSVGDTEMLITTLQNKGVALKMTGNSAQAAELFFDALTAENMKDSAILFLNIAEIYFETQNFDTAFQYGTKALSVLEKDAAIHRLPSAYRLMALIEIERKNSGNAVYYLTMHDFYLHKIIEREKTTALFEALQKYDFEKAQAAFTIKQRNHIIIILCTLLAIIVLTIWLRLSAIRKERTIAQLMLQLDDLRQAEEKLRQSEAQLRQSESHLKEAENHIITPTITDAVSAEEKNTSENEKEINDLRNRYDLQAKTFMSQYFNLLTQIARECKNSEAKEINRLKRLLFGSSDYDFWAASEKLIPKGLLTKIKKCCPELDATEVKICCLTFLNADATAISIALNLKEVTIYNNTSRIRKKLGIEKQKNIKWFLEEKLQKISHSNNK